MKRKLYIPIRSGDEIKLKGDDKFFDRVDFIMGNSTIRTKSIESYEIDEIGSVKCFLTTEERQIWYPVPSYEPRTMIRESNDSKKYPLIISMENCILNGGDEVTVFDNDMERKSEVSGIGWNGYMNSDRCIGERGIVLLRKSPRERDKSLEFYYRIQFPYSSATFTFPGSCVKLWNSSIKENIISSFDDFKLNNKK